MDFNVLVPQMDIKVDGLVSVHYFEYSSDYTFEGESHDFWEFLYVDKGEVLITAGERKIPLKRGQIIFHKPGEFHNVTANGVVAPNLVVVSFTCQSSAMSFFCEKVLAIADSQRALLAKIIEESDYAFTTPLHDPHNNNLIRAENRPLGCEDIIIHSIELLLIEMIRQKENPAVHTTSLIREKSMSDFVTKVRKYFEDNISKKLTLNDICRDNLVGRSYLQKIFREQTGGGAMEYFGELKIEAAKQMIRESSNNFTEISVLLGYNSIHYFSRHFKNVTGMTPSEYSQSVKVLASKKH